MRPAALAPPLLIAGLAVAGAATLEEDYLAALDAAIAKIKRLEAKNADTDRADRQALSAPEGRLRAIIGGLAVKPHPIKGKIA